MAKYFFIGGINKGGAPRGGAEAKNQYLIKKLQSKYKDNINYVDMTSSSLNLAIRYFRLIKGLIMHQHIVLSVASTALEKLAYLNFYLKSKNVTIFIIGGVVDQKLINPRMKKLFENADIAYAETKALAQSIQEKSSFINVKHLPNFKELIAFTPVEKSNQDNTVKFVFLSRVHRDKGIFRAIEVIQHLNKSNNDKLFILDIYGPMDLSDKDKNVFDQLLNDQYIIYNGFIDLTEPEAYTLLSSYHFFLFLTNHPGEGFPGVLIDALHSGSIIIASDWRYNNEIVPEDNLLVDLESDYQVEIKNYINQILNLKEEEFQELVNRQQKLAEEYNIDNINFEIG